MHKHHKNMLNICIVHVIRRLEKKTITTKTNLFKHISDSQKDLFEGDIVGDVSELIF